MFDIIAYQGQHGRTPSSRPLVRVYHSIPTNPAILVPRFRALNAFHKIKVHAQQLDDKAIYTMSRQIRNLLCNKHVIITPTPGQWSAPNQNYLPCTPWANIRCTKVDIIHQPNLANAHIVSIWERPHPVPHETDMVRRLIIAEKLWRELRVTAPWVLVSDSARLCRDVVQHAMMYEWHLMEIYRQQLVASADVSMANLLAHQRPSVQISNAARFQRLRLMIDSLR